jgi:hypothetical protein
MVLGVESVDGSSPSGRSAVWRRAARPCTLGRPGVQVAKGSPVFGFISEARAFESVSVGGPLPGWLALTSPAPLQARDRLDFTFFSTFFFFLPAPTERGISRGLPPLTRARQAETKKITADGGSLGSRVDEERSQLRESM